MSTETHWRRISHLDAQQAAITGALRAMAEGRWHGDDSVKAWLLALDPASAGRLVARVPIYDRAQEDCWQCWSPGELARATGCPEASIRANWPAIHAELVARGIGSREVQAAALGTIAVETARTFEPVEEAFWLDDAWRRANLRYAPFWGRGYVQLTWDYNYRAYGEALGVELVNNAHLATQPDIAAACLAEFFDRAGVAKAAERCEWREVRRRVQGADAGLNHLIEVVGRLGF